LKVTDCSFIECSGPVKVLNKQFSLISKRKGFDLYGIKDTQAETSEAVLTDIIKENVSGAGYEAAVISAALEFEKNSVRYYSDPITQYTFFWRNDL